MQPDYWNMSDAELRAAWAEVDGATQAGDNSDDYYETLNFVEDAILQRIGAPDDASGDEPAWQDRIRDFATAAAADA